MSVGRSRLRRLFETGGVESLGVLVGGVSGLLIVNFLPKGEYAQYTFLIACMNILVGLSNVGLSHCYLPIVGERHRDTAWVLAACRRVYEKRWWLLAVASFFIVPYWLFTAGQHAWLTDPSFWLASGFIAAITILNMREQIRKTLLVIFQKITEINRVGALSYLARLAMVVAALMLAPAGAQIVFVLAATAITSLMTLAMYGRVRELHGFSAARLQEPERRQVDGRIKTIMLPLMLPAVFYQFQTAMTVFLVSALASETSIAEVGAMARLAVLLTVADRVAAMLLFPVIARTPPGPRLRRLVFATHGGYFAIMSLILLSGVLLPQFWILLIGQQYQAQQHLVWVALLTAILFNGAELALATLGARGFTARQSWVIPVVLSTQALYIWVIGVAGTEQALGFSLVTGAAYFLFQYGLLIGKLGRLSRIDPSN